MEFEWDARWAGPPGERLFALEGRRPDADASSDGALVLLHDLGVHGHDLRALAELAPHARVWLVDRLGAGHSDLPAPRRIDHYTPAGLARHTTRVLREWIPKGPIDICAHGYGALLASWLDGMMPRELAPSEGGAWIRRHWWLAPLDLGAEGDAKRVARRYDFPWRGGIPRRAEYGAWLRAPMLAPDTVADARGGDDRAVAVALSVLARGGARVAHEATRDALEREGAFEGYRAMCRRRPPPGALTVLWGDRSARSPGPRLADELGARLERLEGLGEAPQREWPERVAEAMGWGLAQSFADAAQ